MTRMDQKQSKSRRYPQQKLELERVRHSYFAEIPEIDLPDHAKVHFPDLKNILEFKVQIDLTKEDCLWKGGIYDFTVTIPKTYPHSAPKAHCDTPVKFKF